MELVGWLGVCGNAI